jgi:hypothetical protein
MGTDNELGGINVKEIMIIEKGMKERYDKQVEELK